MSVTLHYRVTVVKDRHTRRSKGIAFILFLNRDDAKKCAEEMNMKEVSIYLFLILNYILGFQMFGRTLKASIAKDNGRSTEFIRRKVPIIIYIFNLYEDITKNLYFVIQNYPDKSYCYECGEIGHLSYKCTKNLLGEREPPLKKVRKRKKKDENQTSQV